MAGNLVRVGRTAARRLALRKLAGWRHKVGGAGCLGLLLLAGCATSTPDIRLRNPQTGQTFTCSGEAGRTARRGWGEEGKRTPDNPVKDPEKQSYAIIKERTRR